MSEDCDYKFDDHNIRWSLKKSHQDIVAGTDSERVFVQSGGGDDILIGIDDLRKYYRNGKVLTTEHANLRFHQRGIIAKDIRNAVMDGEIIEQYPNDFPFPSCLILGKTLAGKAIHVVMSDEGTGSRVITAYFPDEEYWNEDYTIRKENAQ